MTTLTLDEKLLEEARKFSKYKTKRKIVTEALQEYIQKRKQAEILKLFGTIDYEADYDYKKQRNVN